MPGPEPAAEIGVVVVDAGVDDRDAHAAAGQAERALRHVNAGLRERRHQVSDVTRRHLLLADAELHVGIDGTNAWQRAQPGNVAAGCADGQAVEQIPEMLALAICDPRGRRGRVETGFLLLERGDVGTIDGRGARQLHEPSICCLVIGIRNRRHRLRVRHHRCAENGRDDRGTKLRHGISSVDRLPRRRILEPPTGHCKTEGLKSARDGHAECKERNFVLQEVALSPVSDHRSVQRDFVRPPMVTRRCDWLPIS